MGWRDVIRSRRERQQNPETLTLGSPRG
jgi:hypothetical protein